MLLKVVLSKVSQDTGSDKKKLSILIYKIVRIQIVNPA